MKKQRIQQCRHHLLIGGQLSHRNAVELLDEIEVSIPYDQHEREILDVIAERDRAENMADKLADKIAAFSGVDIGEHSSHNSPWSEALDINLAAINQTKGSYK